MDIIKICGIGILGVTASLLIKDKSRAFGLMIAIMTGVLLFASILSALAPVLRFVEDLADQVPGSAQYIKILLKCIGVCYIASFAQDLCDDNGEKTLSSGIELAGRAAVVLLSLPMLRSLAEMAFSMMNLK